MGAAHAGLALGPAACILLSWRHHAIDGSLLLSSSNSGQQQQSGNACYTEVMCHTEQCIFVHITKLGHVNNSGSTQVRSQIDVIGRGDTDLKDGVWVLVRHEAAHKLGSGLGRDDGLHTNASEASPHAHSLAGWPQPPVHTSANQTDWRSICSHADFSR